MLKRLEKYLKELGFAWVASVAPPPLSPPSSIDLRTFRKILVIRLDNRIGNVVLITPLLVALKTQFPEARISYLLSSNLAGLAEFIPGVNHFIPYDKRAYARYPLRLRKLVRTIKAEEYDLVIDASDELQLSFNHALTTALSGARYRLGYQRRGSARWLDVAVRPGNPDRHATEMHLDLLRALAPIKQSPRPILDNAAVNSAGLDFRREHGLDPDERGILIHPGGRGAKRRPVELFFALAEADDSTLSARPVVIWGPDESEWIDSVRPTAPEAIIWGGVFPFADLISLMSTASAYISVDNGIMHLASACGVPTIGLFSVSQVDKYRPLGPADRVFDESIKPAETSALIRALDEMIDETVFEADPTVGPLDA